MLGALKRAAPLRQSLALGASALAEASWDEDGPISLVHGSWLGFLMSIPDDSLLLEGYDPDRVTVDELSWRVPLYGALWMLVDAIVDHRLRGRVEVPLEAALGLLAHGAG